MEKPLTKKILSNPKHPFVKILLYIYSMQSFVYSEMNKASRSKDRSKIKFYGAYASALGFIIHCGNKQDRTLSQKLIVYRGQQLQSQEDIEKFNEGKIVNLNGFTSTTLCKNTAIEFAFFGLSEIDNVAKTPTLFEITLSGRNQYFYLGNEDYSAYPEEQEMLLQEGIQYKVQKVDEVIVSRKICEREVQKKLRVISMTNLGDKYKRMNFCMRCLKNVVN